MAQYGKDKNEEKEAWNWAIKKKRIFKFSETDIFDLFNSSSHFYYTFGFKTENFTPQKCQKILKAQFF